MLHMRRPPALPLCLLLADVFGWGPVGRPASAQEDGASRAGGLGEVAGAAAGALADAALGAAAVQVDPFRSGNPILVAEGAAPIRQVSLTAPTYNTGLQKLSAAANYGVFFNDDPKRLPLSRDNLFYYQYPPNLYKRFYMCAGGATAALLAATAQTHGPYSSHAHTHTPPTTTTNAPQALHDFRRVQRLDVRLAVRRRLRRVQRGQLCGRHPRPRIHHAGGTFPLVRPALVQWCVRGDDRGCQDTVRRGLPEPAGLLRSVT